jgi:hypothetical protein
MPQFPLYIPTKSRYDYMVTSKVLSAMSVSHFLIVEPEQVDTGNSIVGIITLITRHLKQTSLSGAKTRQSRKASMITA